MRIRSERAFLFKGDNEEVTIKPEEIKDVPDWVGKTDLFKLALQDKSILVVSTKNKKKIENDEDVTPPPADK